jgi:hypothetical protein
MNTSRHPQGAEAVTSTARRPRPSRRRRVGLVGAILAGTLLVLGVQGPSASTKVTAAATVPAQAALDWNTIAVNTVRAATPAKFQIEGLIYMAYVQAAVYDAVTAISGRYTPYHDLGVNARGASPRAAVAAAAYTTLSYYFPAQAQSLATTYTDYIATTLKLIPLKAKFAGVAVGAAAAENIIASRIGDGRDALVPTPYGVAPQPPGVWVFAPLPSLQSAQTPWVATMQPFLLQSALQFRAPAPPALDSAQYAKDLNEIKVMGGAASTARSAEQTAIAQFWNANVINQDNQMYRDTATKHSFDLVDTVRLLAMGDMVEADAGIACMDSKYHYLFWRPITAIRNADKDGNPGTDANATWTPLLTTPNHPEYPAAHGCNTAAAAEVLRTALKTAAVDVDIPGATGGGTTLTTSRHYATVDDMRKEIVEARIDAGLHYRNSANAGVTLGQQVAQWDLDHAFKAR